MLVTKHLSSLYYFQCERINRRKKEEFDLWFKWSSVMATGKACQQERHGSRRLPVTIPPQLGGRMVVAPAELAFST